MGLMKDFLITIHNGGDEAVAAVQRIGDDWRAMLEQAATEIERRWIPVTDRLPERNEIVLATDQGGVTVGSYSPMLDDWWTLHGDRMAPGAVVTHWMPLPAAPTDAK